MNALIVIAIVMLAVAFGVVRLDTKRKNRLKDGVNRLFQWAEDRGVYPRLPAFVEDYEDDYPALQILEDGHPLIRAECLKLLAHKDRLTDIEVLGGNYTRGGIHAARWKSFMFKSGRFIDVNCQHAPQTAALLRKIPGLYTAFFSVLDPHQAIKPHKGYYKGFVRYHLGVVIPNNNSNRTMWLRVNADREDNRSGENARVQNGAVYHWQEGRGVIFDDTNLHDAANESDQVRVVLWLDLRRRLPFPLQLFNILCLQIAHWEPSVARIRRNAEVKLNSTP